MASLVTSVINNYHYILEHKSDPRTNDWPMMSSPIPTLLICIFYAYFSKVLGPKLMENRKPFNLKYILIVYNFAQTLFSCWIFYEYMMSGWWGQYSLRCQPVDYSRSPSAMRMANVCWWYFFSKFTEFFDTLFFVLRKKNSQVSTLHVIHHGCMPFSVWMGVKFAPGGHSTFFALLNAFVHIIMYFYYMVSAMGPKYQKYIWWKKYLTVFQILQFVAIFTHQFQLFFTDCNYPKSFMIWIGLHGVMFLFLFSDFYKKQYNGRPTKSSIIKNTNFGLCMPVLEEDTCIKKSDSNGTLNNTYIKSDLSDSYNACYSNGSTKGFVSQTQTQSVHQRSIKKNIQ